MNLTPPQPEHHEPIPFLMTVSRAAKALAISERTLWALTNSGEIPSVRFGTNGRNIRYDVDDLRRWIEKHKTN